MQSDLFGPKPTIRRETPEAASDATPVYPSPTPSPPAMPNLALLHGQALDDAAREMVRGIGAMLRASVDEVQQEARGDWRGRGWILTAQTPTASGGAQWWPVIRLVWWMRQGGGNDASAWEVRGALTKARPNNKDLATHHTLSLRLGLDSTMQTLDTHTAYQRAATHLASRGVVAPDACVKELAASAVTAAHQIARAYGR